MSLSHLVMDTHLQADPKAPAPAAPCAESAEDLDEPAEQSLQQPSPQRFQRTAIRQTSVKSSLLTKAIMGHSDDDHYEAAVDNQRRRSMVSNVSVASTADLTSDTGLTSPCRTNTPSPPIPDMISTRLDAQVYDSKRAPLGIANVPEPARDPPRKRCIQFACAAKPIQNDELAARPAAAARATSAQEPLRRPCIKFTHPSTQALNDSPIAGPSCSPTAKSQSGNKSDTSSTPRKLLAPPVAANSSSQPMSLRRPSSKNTLTRPKFLRANSKDLSQDSSQFHEFASGTTREEDWIRQGVPVVAAKLTIKDTLTKENHIRRLGAEAEEEALEEEEEGEAATDDDDLDELDGDNQDDDEDEDQVEEEDSDGYYTDEETGFADSDDEEDDENMRLWTPSHATNPRQSLPTVSARRLSLHEPQSDSSSATNGSIRRVKMRRAKPSSETPDLPDSTDFVCGTLDEDKPLEEAYLSCLAARRNEKLRVIPQDIDPSFPASDPDDDDEEDLYNPVAHESDAEVMVHGEMEDLHHGQDRSRRRRKSEQASPRKYRSPAPKRHHSPPPRPRPRSPKTLFGRQSPRRTRSPAPRALTTPVGSPRHGAHVQFQLAGRPNTTHTKSLPRPAALFPCLKKDRNMKYHHDSDLHVRGAIDIFKGLERKRQRRKEKYYQKYCNRARRGQIPERKPQPGRGAERMKELGLLMAGKKEQGNYVLSI